MFDFDGVIGRTMEDNYLAWKYAFSEYNMNINKEEYFLTEGLNTRLVTEYFMDQVEKRCNSVPQKTEVINEIVSLKERYYMENNNFSLYEGVKPLIRRLKKNGYLLGIVSGANYARLSATLRRTFINKFDVIITGDKVINSKPHPEPYLNAARKLSVDPSECVVIENAPAGITAAKEAGMYCIAVASTLEKIYLHKADKIIDKITDLSEIL